MLGVPVTSCPSDTTSFANAETSGVHVLFTRKEQVTNDGHAEGCDDVYGKKGTEQPIGGKVKGGGDVGAAVVGAAVVVLVVVGEGKVGDGV